jgi:hypothetical protein
MSWDVSISAFLSTGRQFNEQVVQRTGCLAESVSREEVQSGIF